VDAGCLLSRLVVTVGDDGGGGRGLELVEGAVQAVERLPQTIDSLMHDVFALHR